MQLFRLLWRALAVASATALASMQAPLALVFFSFDKKRHRHVRREILRTWSKRILRILNVEVILEGSRPPEPTLLVSNHLGYLDIMLLGSEIPGCFVAKAEIRGWPIAGWVCQSVSTIFVDRALRRDVVRVGSLMSDSLERGDSVVLFPEGTSTNGHQVAPFKTALLAPAASAQLAVHTATISYATHGDDVPAHHSVCWWGVAPFGGHFLGLLKLDGITAHISFGDLEHRFDDRKLLAERLHADVSSRFRPVVDFEPDDPWASTQS